MQSGASDRHVMPGDEVWPPTGLLVLRAGARELAAHDELLEVLAKQSGKAPLWRRSAPEARADAGALTAG